MWVKWWINQYLMYNKNVAGKLMGVIDVYKVKFYYYFWKF